MLISIIIPTLNEVSNIPLVMGLIQKSNELHSFSYEIIFVDDKSTDGTIEAIQSLISKAFPVKLIVSEQRKGLGNALKLGMEKAQGELILFLDCDVSVSADDLVKLILKASAKKMLIGSRYTKGGKTIGAPVVKVFLSKCLNFFMSIYLGIKAIDISHSLRLFPRKGLALPTSDTHPVFFWELSLIATLGGLSVEEIPVTFRERTSGVSKNTTSKMISSVVKGLPTVVNLKRNG